LRASEGYRDGNNDFVTITDPNFIPANIRTGVNIFGKIGSMIEGRPFASIDLADMSTMASTYSWQITGLNFTPDLAFLWSRSFGVGGFYNFGNAFISNLGRINCYLPSGGTATMILHIENTTNTSCVIRAESASATFRAYGNIKLYLISIS